VDLFFGIFVYLLGLRGGGGGFFVQKTWSQCGYNVVFARKDMVLSWFLMLTFSGEREDGLE
jgi:hypothetical protein